jgi:hypothetical protein
MQTTYKHLQSEEGLHENSFDFQDYWKSILQPNQPNVGL